MAQFKDVRGDGSLRPGQLHSPFGIVSSGPVPSYVYWIDEIGPGGTEKLRCREITLDGEHAITCSCGIRIGGFEKLDDAEAYLARLLTVPGVHQKCIDDLNYAQKPGGGHHDG